MEIPITELHDLCKKLRLRINVPLPEELGADVVVTVEQEEDLRAQGLELPMLERIRMAQNALNWARTHFEDYTNGINGRGHAADYLAQLFKNMRLIFHILGFPVVAERFKKEVSYARSNANIMGDLRLVEGCAGKMQAAVVEFISFRRTRRGRRGGANRSHFVEKGRKALEACERYRGARLLLRASMEKGAKVRTEFEAFMTRRGYTDQLPDEDWKELIHAELFAQLPRSHVTPPFFLPFVDDIEGPALEGELSKFQAELMGHYGQWQARVAGELAGERGDSHDG